MQHVIDAIEVPRLFYGGDIGRLLDHADQFLVARRASAVHARIDVCNVVADRAQPKVSLDVAYGASQGLGVYNTSKYAVVGLSETLAKDLKPYGIGVSVLCPMGVQTRILESERSRPATLRNESGPGERAVELIGRYLAPESVADMVLDAIRGGELYVITHDEGLEPLRRRYERMQQSVVKRRKA